MSIVIRKATNADKEFIITSIIEAEKSGSNVVSYCQIFSIDETTFRSILNNILDEDMEGQELCLSGFLIAEADGIKAAAISAWIEQETGMASGVIKSNLLMYFIDREMLVNAVPSIALMNNVSINRDEKALQIECVYTSPEYRGMGLVKQLINEHINQKQKAGALFDKVQIILLKNNTNAIKSYQKAGFTIVKEKTCSDQSILQILPCDTKILMERHLNA
jgi:ribosomal protein S18 acetylase RimI-like enzyme